MPQKHSPQMVDDVLAAIRTRRDIINAEPMGPNTASQYPYEMLADRYPAGAVLDLMDQLSDADILDYGVSLRTAWVCDYDPAIGDRIAAFKRGEEYPQGPE